MKRIIFVILMMIPLLSYSQGEFAIINNTVLKDSSGKIVSAQPFWWQSLTHQFGTSLGVTFDLRMGESDQGGFYFKKNGSTPLFDWGGDDGDLFRFHYGLNVTGDVDVSGVFKVDGVAISAGGGDAYVGGHNTWTEGNIFSDTLKANGHIWLNGPIQISGSLITDLNFQKGVGINAWVKTTDNAKLFLGANSDTALEISPTTNDVRIHEDLYVDGNVEVFGTLGGATTVVNADDISSGGLLDVNDVAINGQITTDMPFEKGGIPNIGTTDNFAMQFITNNVAVIKVGTDSIHYYLPVKLKNKPLIFENTDGAKQAILSTNSSGDLVISTNRAVAITGDLTVTGYTQLGSSGRKEKTVTKSVYINTAGSLYTVAHGIDHRNITSLSLIIKRDTTTGDRELMSSYNATVPMTVGSVISADSLNFRYFVPANSTAIVGDSAIFRAVYTDNY